jgi:hypothetical protein
MKFVKLFFARLILVRMNGNRKEHLIKLVTSVALIIFLEIILEPSKDKQIIVLLSYILYETFLYLIEQFPKNKHKHINV